MSTLDCNTPKGQSYIVTQMACLTCIEAAWKCKAFATNGESTADVDAIIIRDNTVSAVAEVKSREMSLDELEGFGSYLITFEKLLKLRNVGLALHVPCFVIVSLLKSQQIVYWKIADASGNFLASWLTDTTPTFL
jgi:hypothetical protein